MTNKMKYILVVDDDPAICRLVVEAVTSPEFTVYTAHDGVEALKLIDNASTAIDMLIADVVMPRLNGPELVGVLLTHHPEIKIIFISGYPIEELHRYGIPASRIRHIKKPFKSDNLVRSVKEELSS